MLVLRSRNPQAIDKVAHVYLEDENLPPMVKGAPEAAEGEGEAA